MNHNTQTTAYIVKYYDAAISQGVRVRKFLVKEEAEAFAASSRLYARPAKVEKVKPQTQADLETVIRSQMQEAKPVFLEFDYHGIECEKCGKLGGEVEMMSVECLAEQSDCEGWLATSKARALCPECQQPEAVSEYDEWIDFKVQEARDK